MPTMTMSLGKARSATDIAANEGKPRRLSARALGMGIDEFCWKLANEAPDAIIYADSGGMIRFWNQGAERIFGFTPAEVHGRSLDIIIPANLRRLHWDAYMETMRTGKTRYGSGDVLAVPALRKDGSRVSVEFTILPYRNREGRMLGVAAIVRDFTKRFEQNKRFA